MKKTPFLFLIVLSLLAEIVLCFFIIRGIREEEQNPVFVNQCVKIVEESLGEGKAGFEEVFEKKKRVDLPAFTVLDSDGEVLYKYSGKDNIPAEYLANSVNEAVRNSDTILDLRSGENELIGKIIVYNPLSERVETAKRNLMIVLIVFSVIQLCLILAFYFYLKNTILNPFEKLNAFAVRIAGGNLDVPLDVDKGHVFGSFTEAFDLMRSELKKAQMAEKQANDDKKETIAKLSHDIKTPVASIKSTSEIGYELAGDEKSKEYFHLINMKADQITALTDNLFTASVHEATEITVSPVKLSSAVVKECLKNADYLNKTGQAANSDAFEIPECMIFADKLRLQQAVDNIFMNSYKYAGTAMKVEAETEEDYLVIRISDSGPGVKEGELPLLKEKYKRGSNSEGKDGAGLGLYLTNYFLEAMDGKLCLESRKEGFSVIMKLRMIR
ncbi:MAG: HAMP domain-containing histidine kinase [Lachnospiraceae bacterium]|nr:HAMP domain-containing histidine kinase [Lachnospiraceae bacterium]